MDQKRLATIPATDSVDSDEDALEAKSDLPFFIRYPRLTNLFLFSTYLAIGVVYFVFALDAQPSTAFYACVEILTTIGYGDLPFKDVNVFVTIYVLLGLGIIANIMSDIFTEVLEFGEDQLSKSFYRARHLLQADSDSDQPIPIRRCARWSNFLQQLTMYGACVVIWAVFFALTESCTCSYGRTAIEGCVEDGCSTTGGSTMSMGEAFYFAVITFTTVGFGDFAPKTIVGRIFGAFMMILGVLAFASLVGSLAAVIDDFKSSYSQKLRVSPAVFQRFIDQSGDGSISKAEFRSYMLIRQGKVSEELLQSIDALFDSIDRDGNGTLSYDEIYDAECRAKLIES
ncbi:unnamed protein product [Durusdinium trenchii]|uniref:EF-hand domain-containing protein n=1 Tax=Durusdinium trenchii TaxID=1381693 RepID=A0ABP0KP33_9DINO